MKAKFLRLTLLFFLIVAATNCSRRTDSLKIATAANMQFAMEELVSAFEKEKGIPAEMILSSSGKLTAQIEAGAPFDLFFSADEKYPHRLADKCFGNYPKIYAYGRLVKWFKKDEYKFELYAMANPKTAPYGKATEEYLNTIQMNLSDVVYGESISQVNQFILSGTVDAGFTSLSSVMSNKFKNNGSWEVIADSLYSPIAQAYISLKSTKHQEWAKAFGQFIASETAKAILVKYGYRVI